jgi:hypothetical protein
VGTFCPYQTMKIIYPALLKSKYNVIWTLRYWSLNVILSVTISITYT